MELVVWLAGSRSSRLRDAVLRAGEEILYREWSEVDLVDVNTDRGASQEMRKLAEGVRTAQAISICDKVFVGFNRKELEEASNCL